MRFAVDHFFVHSYLDTYTIYVKKNCFVRRSSARLIRSERAGVGKSLLKDNLCNTLRNGKGVHGKDITIPVYKVIKVDDIISRLTAEFGNGYTKTPCNTIHLDIAHEVQYILWLTT